VGWCRWDEEIAGFLKRGSGKVEETSFAGKSAFGEALSKVGGDGDDGATKLVGESEKFTVGKRFGEAIDSQHELVGAAPNC
jgi:hypothetical protein